MNLTIRTHHASIDGDLRERAEKKLARLERFLPRIDTVVVEVSREETRTASDRYSVQCTVHAGSSILRAEERASDAGSALDAACDVLAQQARRHKTRLRDWHRRAGGRVEDAPETAAVDIEPESDEEFDEYLLGKVVRVKTFEAKPMSQEEALARMDLIGHDFFLFLDAATDEYALLYKRTDGGYGMLSPRRG